MRPELQEGAALEETLVVRVRSTEPVLLYDMLHVLQAERRAQEAHDFAAQR